MLRAALKRPSRLALAVLFAVLVPLASFAADAAGDLKDVRRAGKLRWSGDASGGAPYQFLDPDKPDQLVGFEVEIARELGKRLGVKDEFVQIDWGTLIPSLQRGDADISMSGLEVTADRKAIVNFTRPYYIYTQQLVARKDDDRVTKLEDCRGKRVGTLNNSAAERILKAVPGIDVASYDDNVRPYDDLEIGRVDAVLLDLPIAVYHAKKREKLKFVGEPFGEGLYAIAVRKNSPELLAAVDAALGDMVRDGSLKAILDKWGLWNSAQEKLSTVQLTNESTQSFGTLLRNCLPLFLRGTWVTIKISLLAMVLASAFGLCLALMRVYGNALVSRLALAYVEFIRGTPLLVQLFFIYFGLPQIPYIGIKLSGMVAAIVGVGLNYAAYEAEIYRAGIMAVPRAQAEAALALGLTRWQAVRHVILPQALRLVVPPVTNDFVALFKDTSIVSILAISELTFTFRAVSQATGRYFEFAVVTALIYFLLAYPLSKIARKLEERIHPHHDFDTQPM
jgi:polar amino acid transport system substrate-binding protein